MTVADQLVARAGTLMSFAHVGGKESEQVLDYLAKSGLVADSLWPATGGLGAVEAATAASLVAAGMEAGAALAAVAVYRLLSFWMLLGIGWVVMAGLSRRPERPEPPERPALALLS